MKNHLSQKYSVLKTKCKYYDSLIIRPRTFKLCMVVTTSTNGHVANERSYICTSKGAVTKYFDSVLENRTFL